MPSWKTLKDVKVKDVVYWSRQRKRKAGEMEGADDLKDDLTYVVPEKSIGFALDLMGQHNVLTIPIISNYGDPEKETYHGQLDVLRIAGLLLDELGSTKPESTDYNSVCQQLLSASIDDLVKQNRGLLPEDDVTYTEDLLAFAVRHVFTSNAYHRVTVFSSTQPRHAVGMLTQNDILLFFNKFPELMGPQADATLDELGLCNSSIRVINHSDMVLSAFGMMFDHHVREIPVVDDDGKLIGAFNCGVLRGMTSFTGLNMSIGQFAKEYPLRPATPCTKLDKLKDIVARIAEDRRIRSYGVNDKSQPIFDVMLNNMLVSLVNSGWELKDVTVNDIVKSLKKNSPLLLDYDTTLGDCLKEMASHNILTTPVLNPRGAYHGMVDVRDILFEVLDSLDDHYKGTLRETEHAANLYQFSASDRSIIEEVFQRPLRNLTFTKKDMCQLSENILEVLKNCFIPNNFHCVTSFDAAGKIVSTLTQRDIAKFISQYPDILGEAGRKTIEELGLIQGFLRTLHQREPTIEAFRIMREFSVSAVPIVNSVGKLVTCVDSGDLRGLSNFYGLRLMTAFFKSSVPNPEDYPPDQIPVPMPLTCKPTDTLKDILFRIVETSHRRVWCVDDEGRPKCSISLTKILKLMACPAPVEKDSTKFARV